MRNVELSKNRRLVKVILTFARTLNNIGSVYSDKGEYLKALELFESSRVILKMAVGEEHPPYLSLLKLIKEARELKQIQTNYTNFLFINF